jgi:hypothetical protein
MPQKKIFDEDFADQVLSFDSDAADMYAEIAASRRTAGKPIGQFDAMIVSMARSRGASLATRNVKDFEDCGVDVVNPRRGSRRCGAAAKETASQAGIAKVEFGTFDESFDAIAEPGR